MPGSNAFSAAHPAAIPKVVGFLLVYYPDYMNLAVRRFESVISQLDADHVVLVIENAPMPRLAPARTRTIVIQGDNSLREFSGWMAGVRYCEAQGWLDANPLLIFANDTFCHHNKFGLVTKRAFASSFRKLLRARSHAMIAGELQGGAYELSILGHACKSWISTYLFAMTTPLLRRIVSFVPPIDMDSFLNVEGVDDQFFCGPVNAHVKRHLARWLFDSDSVSHWYGAAPPTEENRAAIAGKAKSLLCEIFLAARAAGAKATFVSTFPSTATRQLRRLEHLLGRPGIAR